MARDVVLDAAERLLRKGAQGDFSMRDLAAEAQVGFATPFNHFGSKNAIMQALSSRMVGRMAARFRELAPEGDAFDRVQAMVLVSTSPLLDQPEVYRAVTASLGAVGAAPAGARANSEALWALAVGDAAGIRPESFDYAKRRLPALLAIVYRGCLSFWTAGELTDETLHATFASSAAVLMLGLMDPARRPDLLRVADA